ncbi:MAG: threonine/serine dehydratase [Firmicutes bacterium]|nr:threonine/serine dehydratase [Bacillota bacterium]
MLKIEQVKEAHDNIKCYAKYTPILYSEAAAKDFGFKLMLKAENFQTTNSFKIRGASNCILKELESSKGLKGVVTASSGNHGQAVAYVAYRLRIPAIIVMPETAPEAKIKAVSRWGAKIEFCGTTSQQRLNRSKQIAEQEGYFEIPPYDHYNVIAGQGTIGKEILEQVPDVEAVFIPIGGGGLISGIATYIKNIKPQVKVIGGEPEESNSMSVSIRKGEIVRLDKTDSIADGLLSLEPGSMTFPLVKKFVDDIETVSELEISSAMIACIEYFKTVPEPSGAVSVAAAIKSDWRKGKKIVSLVSGGNIDMNRLYHLTCV